MKQVFTAPSVVPCDILKSVLEARGIECLIRNERGSTTAGVGYPLPASPSLPFAWPEVWVNDEDFDEASLIAADYRQSSSQKTEDGMRKAEEPGATA